MRKGGCGECGILRNVARTAVNAGDPANVSRSIASAVTCVTAMTEAELGCGSTIFNSPSTSPAWSSATRIWASPIVVVLVTAATPSIFVSQIRSVVGQMDANLVLSPRL